ncbi:MAG: hypothetical protein LBC53_06845 [Spirochaetaceae bacterium]|jgi:hypothetical protein|nr:hypothetical protein [Spirochaetaceae bacterium]
MIDWRDELYQKTFNEELRGVRLRLRSESGCTLEDLTLLLKQLYEMEGSDWLGRGEVAGITLNAQIAAYETACAAIKAGQSF